MQKTNALNYRFLFGFWLLICVVFAFRTMFTGAMTPLFADTDDAMRMVSVLDLLNGQGWYDHVQHRLNTPFGADIHWSRLIDFPLAAMVWLLQPFFGALSITIIAWLWPLSLLLVLLYFSARLSTYLLGPDALLPGVVLPVLSAAILVEFAPGRVDHHNVQIVLTLVLLYTTMRAWAAPLWAIPAGVVAATSLAIGMEALPQIIVAIAIFGLFYVVDFAKAKSTRIFGIVFGLSALTNLAIAMPIQNWSAAACDALSIVHVSAAISVGVVFSVLPIFKFNNWAARLALGAILGVAAVASILLIFPHCLGGPYGAIGPWLTERWLSKIVEAKPVWHSLSAIPAYTLGIVLPPLAATIALFGFILKAEKNKRAQWLILGMFLIAGILVTLVQVRGARLVAGMVAPVGAWVILYARQKYLNRQSVTSVLGLLGSWLLFAGLAIAVLAGYILPKGSDEIFVAEVNIAEKNVPGQIALLPKSACLQPDIFVDLASIPPERIMAPVDLGAHLLLFTSHAVVGAPYHRNQQGLIDSFNFFNLPLDEARKIISDRGISLIVTCPYLPEMNGFADAAENSFVRTVPAGELPDWLVDFTLPGATLNVYGVVD